MRTSPRAPSGLSGLAYHPKCSNNPVIPTHASSSPPGLQSVQLLTPIKDTESGLTHASPWGCLSSRGIWWHAFAFFSSGP